MTPVPPIVDYRASGAGEIIEEAAAVFGPGRLAGCVVLRRHAERLATCQSSPPMDQDEMPPKMLAKAVARHGDETARPPR